MMFFCKIGIHSWKEFIISPIYHHYTQAFLGAEVKRTCSCCHKSQTGIAYDGPTSWTTISEGNIN